MSTKKIPWHTCQYCGHPYALKNHSCSQKVLAETGQSFARVLRVAMGRESFRETTEEQIREYKRETERGIAHSKRLEQVQLRLRSKDLTFDEANDLLDEQAKLIRELMEELEIEREEV